MIVNKHCCKLKVQRKNKPQTQNRSRANTDPPCALCRDRGNEKFLREFGELYCLIISMENVNIGPCR